MKKITISNQGFYSPSSSINLEQKDLAFLGGIGPAICYNLVSRTAGLQGFPILSGLKGEILLFLQ